MEQGANRPAGQAAATDSSSGQVALASFIGTTTEWYDFFLYGTTAALVFNRLFFPTFDPLAGTLAAFGTFALGFVARPLGGIVFGHYGDRLGRKPMLVLTLLIMGFATFCIGLLPTYSAVGILAPILLLVLRLAQGFGVGGEWGGAVLMAVEHASEGKRGFQVPKLNHHASAAQSMHAAPAAASSFSIPGKSCSRSRLPRTSST